MFGGMITTPLLSMFVVPAIYLLRQRAEARRWERAASGYRTTEKAPPAYVIAVEALLRRRARLPLYRDDFPV